MKIKEKENISYFHHGQCDKKCVTVLLLTLNKRTFLGQWHTNESWVSLEWNYNEHTFVLWRKRNKWKENKRRQTQVLNKTQQWWQKKTTTKERKNKNK